MVSPSEKLLCKFRPSPKGDIIVQNSWRRKFSIIQVISQLLAAECIVDANKPLVKTF
jgi:hypothetical protein